MVSIKFIIALLFAALIVWLISNLPEKLALFIYDTFSFIVGILGVFMLIFFIFLFIYTRLKF